MNIKLRTGLATGFAAVIGATTALAVPTAALAHGVCSYIPNSRGFGCVLDGHVQGYAHDSKADGKGVRVHLWTNVSGNKYVVGDGNGSASGDGWKTLSGSERFTSLQACAGANNVDEECGPKITA